MWHHMTTNNNTCLVGYTLSCLLRSFLLFFLVGQPVTLQMHIGNDRDFRVYICVLTFGGHLRAGNGIIYTCFTEAEGDLRQHCGIFKIGMGVSIKGHPENTLFYRETQASGQGLIYTNFFRRDCRVMLYI